MFFVAATLLLVTIAVFAGKSKFTPFTLYYWDSTISSYGQLTSSFTMLFNLNINGTGTAVSVQGMTTKGLYASDNGGGKIRVYTNSF